MPSPFVESLKIRDFRALADAELHFDPGWNFFTGANAQGKTSLLEAVTVLLRLQSPRTRRAADLVRFHSRGLLLDGWFGGRHLQFYYSPARKKLALDGVEQKTATEYLACGSVVFFSNEDIQLVRGTAGERRRFLDFLAVQMIPGYRIRLRSYERALRSRNRLLKQPGNPWREIAAYDGPLVEAGEALMQARQACVSSLAPLFTQTATQIAGGLESDAQITYVPGVEGSFQAALEARRTEEKRLGQTLVGPHRDDLLITLDGHPAADFASEGQQRTLVLAMKTAEALWIAAGKAHSPILLLDDIFGELDADRRNAVLAALPQNGQRFISSTGFAWMKNAPGPVWKVEQGCLVAGAGSKV